MQGEERKNSTRNRSRLHDAPPRLKHAYAHHRCKWKLGTSLYPRLLLALFPHAPIFLDLFPATLQISFLQHLFLLLYAGHLRELYVRNMANLSTSLLWTLILLLTALLLAFAVIAQILTTYTTAYLAAPRELTTFIDVVDFSIQENESYDCDVSKVPRLEDKIRLGRLLREIQKAGDDLREDLNQLVVAEGGKTLRASARILWAGHRKGIEDRVRRLDLLRMRFLVVYMGILATAAGEREKSADKSTTPKSTDKTEAHHHTPHRPIMPRGFSDAIAQKKQSLRITTQPTQTMGHSEKTELPHRTGWAGVVQELQRSPRMRQRHASIEGTMRSPPPMSPLGSPLSLSPVREGQSLKGAKLDLL
ncbi:hypothetical protein F4780DRAFT_673913 [Xylariomycetidae sp. FL0641]|nr:hypothetical protein F4780DRAFT_673913 [Xylariomycetidae sp. FL0641]